MIQCDLLLAVCNALQVASPDQVSQESMQCCVAGFSLLALACPLHPSYYCVSACICCSHHCPSFPRCPGACVGMWHGSCLKLKQDSSRCLSQDVPQNKLQSGKAVLQSCSVTSSLSAALKHAGRVIIVENTIAREAPKNQR